MKTIEMFAAFANVNKAIADEIIANLTIDQLRTAVENNDDTVLLSIKGVGIKTSVRLMDEAKKFFSEEEETSDDDMSMKKVTARLYSVPCFEPQNLFSDNDQKLLADMRGEDPEIVVNAAMKLAKSFEQKINDPFVVPSILQVGYTTEAESALSDICGINYYERNSCMAIVNHNILDLVRFSASFYKLADSSQSIAANNAKRRVMDAYILRICNAGFVCGDSKWSFYTATASMLKQSKAIFIERKTLKEKARQLSWGRNSHQFGKINGTEIMKRRALLASTSVPISAVIGKKITLRDCAVISDIEGTIKIENVVEVSRIGDNIVSKLHDSMDKPVTHYDGQAFIIDEDIPSYQGRAMLAKYFAVKIGRAKFKAYCDSKLYTLSGVTDIDGEYIDIDRVKIIFTESCWKGLGMYDSWKELVEVAEEIGLDELRVCATAIDRADISNRTLCRQGLQGLLSITDGQLSDMADKESRFVEALKDKVYVYNKLSGKKKEDSKCENDELLFRVFPDLLASSDIYAENRTAFRKAYADGAAGRIHNMAGYQYIAEDPYAMIDVVWGKKDVSDPELGILRNGEVANPNMELGDVFMVRYPANFPVGMASTVVKNGWFEEPVTYLPYNSDMIIRADGDFDGDEMFWTQSKILIDAQKKTTEEWKLPLIVFAHDKAPKHDMPMCNGKIDMMAWNEEIAESLYVAAKNNTVGKWSNLSTRILAHVSKYNTGEDKQLLMLCVYSHVCTILAVDMMKTGETEFSKAMLKAIEPIQKAFLAMPDNQRYCRHADVAKEGYAPFDDSIAWKDLEAPGEGVVDRWVREFKNRANEEFDMDLSGLHFHWEWMVPHDEEGKIAYFPSLRRANITRDIMELLIEYAPNDVRKCDVLYSKEPVNAYELMNFIRSAHTSIKSKHEAVGYEERMHGLLRDARKALAIFAQQSYPNMTDDEAIDYVAKNLVRQRFNNKTQKGVVDKAAYMKFVYWLVGDKLAEHVKENAANGWMAPANDPNSGAFDVAATSSEEEFYPLATIDEYVAPEMDDSMLYGDEDFDTSIIM